MTTDKTSTDVVGTTTGTAVAREFAEQYWTAMARTADLVRKLTSLADRYEAIEDGDAGAADRRQRVALLRATAESGRRLIRSLAPPALPLAEQGASTPVGRARLQRGGPARSRAVQAAGRDAAALAADRPDALAARRAEHIERDRAAGAARPDPDGQARTYALVNRLEERAIVRQAQGILMQRAGLTAGEAFETLLLAATGRMTLESVADHVVRGAELPAIHDVP